MKRHTLQNWTASPSILFCIILFVLNIKCFSQVSPRSWIWANNAGNRNTIIDGFGEICNDPDGNTYIIGSYQGQISFSTYPVPTVLTSAGNNDIFLAKYDPLGNVIWAKSMGGAGIDGGWAITYANGHLYFTGNYQDAADFGSISISNNPNTRNIYVAKCNAANGDMLWVRQGKGSDNNSRSGYGIAVDAAENVYISGSFIAVSIKFDPLPPNFSAGSTDIFIAKFNSNGDIQWVRTAGSTESGDFLESANDIVVDQYSNVYIAGQFNGTVAHPTMFGSINLSSAGGGGFSETSSFVAKFNQVTMNWDWVKPCLNTSIDFAKKISLDETGNIYVDGFFKSVASTFGTTTINPIGTENYYVVKYLQDGSVAWAKPMPGAGYGKRSCSRVDHAGNIVFGGTFDGTITLGSSTLSTTGFDDFYIACLDAGGVLQWSKQVNSDYYAALWGLNIQSDGSVDVASVYSGTIYFGGTVFSSSSSSNVAIAKLSADPTRRFVNDNSLTGDVYTIAAGNDMNPGTASAPFATLAYALARSNPGDSIFIDAGNYVSPDIIINKSIHIIGSNYLVSPNDPLDKFSPNAARNTESIVTGSTFTIGSNDISIEGLTLNAGSKTSVLLNNAGFSHFNFLKNKLVSNFASNLVLTGTTVSGITPPVATDYKINDNRFEKAGNPGGTVMLLNYLVNVQVENNSYVVTTGTARNQVFMFIGGSGLVNNVDITENVTDGTNYSLFTFTTSHIKVTNNNFRNSLNGILLQSVYPGAAEIEFNGNQFAKSFPLERISILRDGGSLPGSTTSIKVNNNHITGNATNNTGFYSTPLQIQVNNPVLAPIVTVRENSIDLSGNFSLVSNNNFAGLSLIGNLLNTTVESNDIRFQGFNLPGNAVSQSPLVNPGILINSSQNSIASINASCNITLNRNRLNGFKQSVAVYNGTAYGNLPLGILVNMHENSFEGDSISINNGSAGEFVNATCNWYNSNDPAGILPKLTGATVHFIPWLSTGTDISPGPGLQPAAGTCDGGVLVVGCPAAIITSQTPGQCSINVNTGQPVFNNNSLVASVTNDAPPSFNVGNSIVTWTITDFLGNIYHCTQPVTITAAEETCNGIDDNCNGIIDEGFPDTDGDHLADCVDTDDDNDGTPDWYDCEPLNPSNNRWLICHNNHTLCVAAQAANALIKQGASLGPCIVNTKTSAVEDYQRQKDELDLKVYPNPASKDFYIKVESGDLNVPASFRILNAFGQQIETWKHIYANTEMQIGNQYGPGVYYLQVKQGNLSRTIKLVKTSH
jgi:hypothetical protein